MQHCTIGLAAISSVLLGACADADTSSTVNQSFDRWCDAGPCDWEVNDGVVTQAATWHAKDYAVEFPPGAATISQRQGRSPAPCMRFDVIARVAPEATLSLELDFNDDGYSDGSYPISQAQWRSVPFLIATPIEYENVRLRLVKQGGGSVILAQIVVNDAGECPDVAPLRLNNGSICALNAVCRSGACVSQRCVEEKPTGSE